MADLNHTTTKFHAEENPFDFDVTTMDFHQLAALREALDAMRAVCSATSDQPRCIARQSAFGIVDHTPAGNILVEIQDACGAALDRIEDETWRRGYHSDAEDADAQFEIAMLGVIVEGPRIAAQKMKQFLNRAA